MVIGRRQLVLGSGIAISVGAMDRTPGAFARMTEAPQSASGAAARVRNGIVSGSLNDGVRAFTNIPFGKIPARFAAAEPAAPWSGIYDATGTSPIPVQGALNGDQIATGQSEDCLHLNIWAPNGPGPYPVLIFIYGGGNIGGSISQPIYEGSAFARHGIICVCINYRVGVFGFLELGDATGEHGTGNNAVKDQILGLQWVRDNIAAFGGDPRRITIAGQSAGAGDCTVLATLPVVQNMIQAAIIVSGGGGIVNTPDRANAFAAAFINKLGGAHKLRTASAAHILETQKASMAEFRGAIRPVLDGTLITRGPLAAFAAGDVSHIRLMAGFTRDEESAMPVDQAANLSLEDHPFNFCPENKRAELVRLYEEMVPPMETGRRNLRILAADQFKVPTLIMLQAQADHGGVAYAYEMNYSPEDCTFPMCKHPGLSMHAGDLPLIFDHLSIPFARVFGYSDTEEERRLAHDVGLAWASFIKDEPVTLGTVAWERYARADRAMMVIDKTCSLQKDPWGDERRAWAEIGVLSS